MRLRKGQLKDMNNPEYFPYEYWAYSQLSVARFFGGCKYNGEDYVVDMDTGDLVKASFVKEYVANCKAKRIKESSFAQARAELEKQDVIGEENIGGESRPMRRTR